MKPHAAALLVLVLAGCGLTRVPPASPAAVSPEPLRSAEPASAAAKDGAGPIPLRCANGLTLSLRPLEDMVRLEGLPEGPEILLRDAGGVTPQHSVFANARWRAEFGVGPAARGAVLHPLQPPGDPLRCEEA